MPSFESFVARHGEAFAQNLIENIERFSGIRVRLGQPLEERWMMAMECEPQDNLPAQIQ